MLLQKRQGIQTDQIAKREKRDKIFYTELLMKIAAYSVVLAEVISIFAAEPDLPMGILTIGALLGIAGDIIFAAAVVTMRDSWRAHLFFSMAPRAYAFLPKYLHTCFL